MNKIKHPSRTDELLRLQWSIRALAQDADVQVGLFPSFACVADELALEFDESLRRLSNSDFEAELSKEQLSLIQSLDAKLAGMSGPANEALWNDEALETAQEWQDVREIARQILEKLGWPKTAPPPERAVYVGPDA